MRAVHGGRVSYLSTSVNTWISASAADERQEEMSHFYMSDFAFAAYPPESNPYMQCIKRAAAVQSTLAAPCGNLAWRCVMKLFSLLKSRRSSSNLTTALERQRLGRTMPGQTGAIAGTRLGVFVG
jgi:hypothetical protein